MKKHGYIALSGLFFASVATAGNWYAGIGAGEVDAEYSPLDPPSSSGIVVITGRSYEHEDSSTASKVFGGYRFNEYFSLQGGYIDMDELTTSRDRYTDVLSTIDSTTTISVEGFTIAASGRYPLSERVAVKGGAGIYEWDEDTDSQVTGTGRYSDFDFSYRGDGEGTDWYYSIGLEVWWFTLEHETYTLQRPDSEIDVGYTGLSWQYEF